MTNRHSLFYGASFIVSSETSTKEPVLRDQLYRNHITKILPQKANWGFSLALEHARTLRAAYAARWSAFGRSCSPSADDCSAKERERNLWSPGCWKKSTKSKRDGQEKQIKINNSKLTHFIPYGCILIHIYLQLFNIATLQENIFTVLHTLTSILSLSVKKPPHSAVKHK